MAPFLIFFQLRA